MSKRNGISLRGVAIALSASLALFASALSLGAEDLNYKVRFAAATGMTGLGNQLGIAKGFYKDAGVNLELLTVSDFVSAFASGGLDVVDSSTTTAIIGAGRGSPFKIVGSMFRTKGPFYLIAKPSITKVEDLKGKKVGVAIIGSGMDAYVRVILKAHGLDPDKDVTLISNGAYQAALASLESGAVDATIIHEPFVTLAETKGTAKLLAKGWDYLPNFHTGVIMASNKFISEHPELLRRLLATYYKANAYALDHPDELVVFGTKLIGVDPQVLKKALERERVLWENKPGVDLKSLEETQKIQVELGFQDRIYDTSKILDLRFLPKN